MRFRNVLLVLFPILLTLALFFTDVDKGATTAIWFLGMGTGVIAVALAHLSRKGLFDYIDMQEYAKKASETPLGSAIVFLGVCVVLYGLLGLFTRSAHAMV